MQIEEKGSVLEEKQGVVKQLTGNEDAALGLLWRALFVEQESEISRSDKLSDRCRRHLHAL